MELISVIMSAYDESIEEIMVAINSMRAQTYTNIEIILIIDNPQRVDIKKEVSMLHDTRIKTILNSSNIGLAQSMNLAASMAQGDYLARMDSDDISYPERLKKEMECLKKKNADYVCTWIEQINEYGSKCKEQKKQFSNVAINALLPYVDTICHPTVLIKKIVFNKIGGYRNFPCAQDYDLWLRLYDAGYRVAVVEEILLSYRVRSNSISAQKGLQQFYTAEYIRRLSRERYTNSSDSFSAENYKKFLAEKGALNPNRIKRWKTARKERLEKGRWCYLHLIIYSSEYRKLFLNGIRVRYIEWRLKILTRSDSKAFGE